MLQLGAINKFAKELIEKFDVRPTGCEGQLARGLSGGNQQKVIIGREVTNDPDLLIAVQPTGAWTWVPSSMSTGRWWNRGTKAKRCCLSPWSWTRSSTSPTAIAIIYDGSIVDIIDCQRSR